MKLELNETDGSHMSNGDWECWWWRDLNPHCRECENECKQSAMAEILCCPQYKEKT